MGIDVEMGIRRQLKGAVVDRTLISVHHRDGLLELQALRYAVSSDLVDGDMLEACKPTWGTKYECSILAFIQSFGHSS